MLTQSVSQKFTGGPFGITSKIPESSFSVTQGKEYITVHEADNGSGTMLHREFCKECGSPILERGVSTLVKQPFRGFPSLSFFTRQGRWSDGGTLVTDDLIPGQCRRFHVHLLRDTRQADGSAAKGRILLQQAGQLDARGS